MNRTNAAMNDLIRQKAGRAIVTPKQTAQTANANAGTGKLPGAARDFNDFIRKASGHYYKGVSSR